MVKIKYVKFALKTCTMFSKDHVTLGNLQAASSRQSSRREFVHISMFTCILLGDLKTLFEKLLMCYQSGLVVCTAVDCL